MQWSYITVSRSVITDYTEIAIYAVFILNHFAVCIICEMVLLSFNQTYG